MTGRNSTLQKENILVYYSKKVDQNIIDKLENALDHIISHYKTILSNKHLTFPMFQVHNWVLMSLLNQCTGFRN